MAGRGKERAGDPAHRRGRGCYVVRRRFSPGAVGNRIGAERPEFRSATNAMQIRTRRDGLARDPCPAVQPDGVVGRSANEAGIAGVELADAVGIAAHVAEAAKTRRSP